MAAHEFLFFALGLSIGFVIGCYGLLSRTCPTISSSSIPPSFEIKLPSPPPPPPVILPAQRSSIDETTANNNVTSLRKEEVAEENLLRHSMSDEELLRKASSVGRNGGLWRNSVPKVAFLFLTRGPLPLARLWELFLKGHKGYYSVYVHAHPSYKDPSPPDSVFHGRYIPSQGVKWGTISVVRAERRLLANALLDPLNRRFVLLSESCIPVFHFSTVYNYLINSKSSFVDSFDSPLSNARGRYNPKMWPIINVTDWRKGSQWFEIHRELAIDIVSDDKFFNVFEEHLEHKYSDEHYLPTLMNIRHPNLIANRSITFTDWTKGGVHPASFESTNITENLLNRIRFGSNCTYNGVETRECFIFARKFKPSALEPLLGILGFYP